MARPRAFPNQVRFGLGLVERCGALERKCFAKHEAMDISAETKSRGSMLLCALAPAAEWPDVGALGAAASGQPPPPVVAGYLVLQRSSVAASIAKLVVAPARRRQGVGRRLLERAIALARQGRAQLCTLNVDAHNEPAKSLYASLGFRVVSTRPEYYCVGRDAHAMELQLHDGA